MRRLLIILCFLLTISFSFEIAIEDEINATISKLEKSLQSHYWKKNQKMVFPILWERRKGLYGSTVRMNFVDRFNS